MKISYILYFASSPILGPASKAITVRIELWVQPDDRVLKFGPELTHYVQERPEKFLPFFQRHTFQ